MTSNKDTSSSLDAMKTRISDLEAEKAKLQFELKAREEMMSNLLSYIQNSTKA